MRSTSLASLLIGFGIGFGVMYPLMRSRAPKVLSAMPKPAERGRGRADAPQFDTKRFEQLKETVAKDPKNYGALMELGEMQSGRRQFVEAIGWYEKALEVRDTVEIRNLLGVTLYEIDRVDEAVAQFNKALEKEPGNPIAMYNLGIVLVESRNDPEGAVAMWEKLIQMNPGLPDLDVVKRAIQTVKEKRR
jgi:Flp pilus assembly protein TadD